ncbi:Guanine nucleotide-binding protein subunit gamma 1 [Cardamine amara subsp. amara]|uniref:Guanine nucleotide-binding protein subunit gamma 1 n=1 Tax=Cardamine amara subsp. amara TaxID=228776 RepID=A0ABD0ZSJ7_CARAN
MEETVVLEEEALSLVGNGDARGKHRILAELARVEQEVTFLEQELEELDQADIVSTVCEELLFVIEKRPDPLLPLTNEPLDLGWDRWFEGPNGGEGCRCLIL